MSTKAATAAELQRKGIDRRDVQRLMKQSESRIARYSAQYAHNGCRCSAGFQAAWDAECARWDHLRATLAGMPQ